VLFVTEDDRCSASSLYIQMLLALFLMLLLTIVTFSIRASIVGTISVKKCTYIRGILTKSVHKGIDRLPIRSIADYDSL
jgi:hypothetical protein